MIKRILTTALCMLTLDIASAQWTGAWNGTLQVGRTPLPLQFNIDGDTANGYSVTLDSPAQGAKGIPGEISVDNDSITVTIHAIGVRYTSVYRSDTDIIDGQFTQSGMSFPLTLSRGAYTPPRPQTPVPPYPYETREVTFSNTADQALLSGTLTLPMRYFTHKGGPTPAVVMVTGSGLQNRDEEVAGHRPFAVIAHHLALCGIASLRYDDRSFGRSTGDASSATTTTFADDAAAALAFLRDNVPGLGAKGVLGHSEGGTISFILASRDLPDFIIAMAPCAVRGDSVLLDQNRRIGGNVLPSDTNEEYITALARVFAWMETNPGAASWQGLNEAIADLPHLTPELKANLAAIISSRNPWLDHFMSFDPTPAITATRCPVFAIFGTHDMQVNAAVGQGALERHLPENALTVIKTYNGLNHLFQHSRGGGPEEYSTIDETISPEVLTDIATWIKSLPDKFD